MKSGLRSIVAFALFAAMPLGNAGASVTYSYVGEPFTQFYSPTYNSSDYVTLSFTLPSALGDNFNGAVDPTSFTAFDGVGTVTNGPLSSFTAEVETNGTGEISEWAILALYSSSSFAHEVLTADGLGDSVPAINELLGNLNKTQDQGQFWACAVVQCEEYAEASTYFNQGSWSAVSTGVPEPSTWAMTLLAFAGTGFAEWLRSRKGRGFSTPA